MSMGVTSLPAFSFFLNGNKVGQYAGSKWTKCEDQIVGLLRTHQASFSGATATAVKSTNTKVLDSF